MEEMKPRRLRRVQLATPASSEEKIEKAAASAADHVFLDFEDAVAPAEKPGARAKAVAGLRSLEWGRKTRCVRINDVTTKYCYSDVVEVVSGAREHLDTIMIPKVRSAEDVRFVATLLRQVELEIGLEKPVGIEVLVEEVEALRDIEDICAAHPRVEAVIFGMGDYAASHGIEIRSGGDHDYPGDIWHYPRFRMVMAARAARIDPIDGPYGNFRNLEVYRTEALRGRALGCVGKWALHPIQIEPALEIFTPDREAVAYARKLAKVYAESLAKGEGVIDVDGVVIDVASIRHARRLIEQAEMMGL